MMKKIRHTFLPLAAAVMLAVAMQGCKESGPSDGWNPGLTARYLHLETNSLSFGAATQLEHSVEVKAMTTPWQFTGMADWLTLAPTTGSGRTTVSATASENLSGDNSRTCLLVLSSTASDYTYSATLQATQTYAEPYINLSKSSITFDGSASAATVQVSSNIGWQVSSSSHWLTVEASNDASSITLKASENTTNAARSATVTLSGRTSAVITVTQAVAKIEGDQATLTYKQEGGTYQLSVRSEASWTASTEQTWVQIDPMQGSAGTTSVLVTVTPNASENERRGLITFSIGGKKRIEVAIVQKGQYIETDAASLNFTAAGGSQSLQVLSNVSWTLRSKPEWLTLSADSGTGDRTLQVTASENPELYGRSGSLVFGIPGGTLTATVTVSQAAKQFTPEAFTLLHFSDKAGTDTLRFNTDASWTASSADSWISITPKQGKDNGRIAVTVTENTAADKRTGSIAVQVGSTEKSAIVEQDGKFFTVTAGGQATIPSTGGNHTVSFQTNDTWTVEKGSSWMTVSPTEGNGNGSVSLTAGDHPSIKSRTDTTCISPKNLQGIRIITTQAARYLRVDHTSLTFFSKGGTSEAVVVETDATYTVSTEQSWLEVSFQGNAFTVTAQPYDGQSLREGTVSLTMTGLKQGESYRIDIPVLQYAEGFHFTLLPFDEDERWNLAGGTDATLSVIAYGSDENWNPSGKTTLTVTIGGYEGNDDWNLGGGESVDAGHGGYGDNDDWNLGGGESMDVEHGGYGENENWNL